MCLFKEGYSCHSICVYKIQSCDCHPPSHQTHSQRQRENTHLIAMIYSTWDTCLGPTPTSRIHFFHLSLSARSFHQVHPPFPSSIVFEFPVLSKWECGMKARECPSRNSRSYTLPGLDVLIFLIIFLSLRTSCPLPAELIRFLGLTGHRCEGSPQWLYPHNAAEYWFFLPQKPLRRNNNTHWILPGKVSSDRDDDGGFIRELNTVKVNLSSAAR